MIEESGSKGKADKSTSKSTYPGMHYGTVRGKGFEASRRARKSHFARRMQRSEHERALMNGKAKA